MHLKCLHGNCTTTSSVQVAHWEIGAEGIDEMESAESQSVMGVWGSANSGVPGQSPDQVVRGLCPPEDDGFL
jgi:hypothetical protein